MASSTSNVSNVTLVGDAGIPIVGLGTYKALGTDVEQAVVDAIELGYRHFDTADYYAVRFLLYCWVVLTFCLEFERLGQSV